MADYWKSLPKKYCDFCKCWITDNKASRDFHERGLRHQANVRRRVKEIQKNSSIQEHERQQYNNELLKIEAAALNAFKGDISRNPALASEYSSSKSISAQISRSVPDHYSSRTATTNRFGDAGDSNESEILVNGKTRALETIAKSFEKKSKWLEAKAGDGTSYYWNKDTLETRTEAPKSGFLSIAEQEQFKSLQSTGGETSATADQPAQVYRVDPYGGWRTVEQQDTNKIIDLQLPDQNVSEIVLEVEQNKAAEASQDNSKRPAFEFQEKTVESLGPKRKNEQQPENISFKKKNTNRQRNIRNRLED